MRGWTYDVFPYPLAYSTASSVANYSLAANNGTRQASTVDREAQPDAWHEASAIKLVS